MPEAESALSEMPVWLQGAVEAHLNRRAEDTSNMSRPAASPPYPRGGMISEDSFGPIDGSTYYVTVFFMYGQDEVSLVVRFIGRYHM